jgi:hypothetical protein
MKKAITIFILLLIAAGVVLYFGWVNVKPGFFGIAHSTLTGTVEYALESGKIHWFWQKLIPKSFHLYMVERKPVMQSFITTHPLPGSEQLAEFGNFNLTIQIDVQYSIEYEAALKLIERGLFEEFEEHFAHLMSTRVDEVVAAFMLDNMTRHSQYDEDIGYGTLSRLEKSIEGSITHIAREYELVNTSWSIIYVEIPQMELYNNALGRYFSHLEKVYRFKEKELDRESENLALMKEYDMEIDRWERYGELIQKYPELLKFFYIEKFSEQADVLVLPQNESTGFPKMLEPWELMSRTPSKPMEKPSSPIEEDDAAVSRTEVPRDEESAEASARDSEQAKEADLPETGAGDFSEQDSSSEDEHVWYEKLMFWKHIGKGDGT